MKRARGTTMHGAALASALALVGCVLQTGGQGGSSANVGENDSTTAGSTTMLVDASAGSTAVDPSLDTGLDDTATESSSSSGPDPSTSDGSTSDGSTSDGSTTGEPLGCIDDGDCPANWVCVSPDCINPDEGQPCVAGCGPAAPFCGADQLCHDGTEGDSCVADDQCMGLLLCGPSSTCQDGGEGDVCLGPEDCGPLAPICSIDAQCHDGTNGDPCIADDACAGSFLCGPTSTCQDGDEGDPCVGPEDCGAAAPHCPYDSQCHDGDFGDPCTDSSQCNIVCVSFFCI